VKVLDFGLAKIAKPLKSAPASEVSTMAKTKPGVVFGTVHYMSPEQALGREVDLRSDIFSFGILLYEMTAGRVPFSGASTTEIMDRIIHDEPDAIARFNYNTPAELERIIRKCLEKEPGDRYQSTHDVLIDLRNLKRDTSSGRVKVPVTERRTKLPLLAAAIVLAIAGFVIFRLLPHGRMINSLAILPFSNATKNPDLKQLGDGIAETLIKGMANTKGLKLIAWRPASAFKEGAIDLRKIAHDLEVGAVLAGSVSQEAFYELNIEAELIDSNGVRLWSEKYEGRPPDLESIQNEILQQIPRALGLNTPLNKQKYNSSKAFQAYLKGCFFLSFRGGGNDLALENFNRAIQIDPNYAQAYSGLADAYLMQTNGPFIEPQLGLKKAKEAAFKAQKLDDMSAEAHTSLAAIKNMEWDFAGAEKEYQRAIQLDSSYATAHQWYSEYLASMGRPGDALDQAELAARADPFSCPIQRVLAQSWYNLQEYAKVFERKKVASKFRPEDYCRMNDTLALTYEKKNMFREAIDEYKKTYNTDAAAALENDYRSLGYATAIRRLNEKTIRWLKERSKVSKIWFNTIALLYAEIGENDQAFEWFEKSYQNHDFPLPDTLGYCRYSHRLKSFREDPRFAELLKRVGLPVKTDFIEPIK